MGCCTKENEEDVADKSKIRSCTDVPALVVFVAFWFLLILIAAFAFVFGNPRRLIHGYDSFGNVCGTKNDRIGDLELSGLDMRDKPYLFYLDVSNISKSLKICVSKCPNRTLISMQDVISFYNETHSDLCRYDIRQESGENNLISSSLGPCPVFPVYESSILLHRCVPKPVSDVAKGIVSRFYGAINNWDTVEQILADLYATWPHMILFSILALFLSLIVVSILHFMASFVSWIFFILISLASLACTIVLWWTYITLKLELDAKPVHLLLLRNIHNEQALLAFSIITTILTIILLLLVFVMRKHVSFISDVFKESSKCLNDIPMLFLQPIITFLILFAFFALWTAIAVSLATANYTGIDKMKPYADLQVAATMPSTPFNEQQSSSTSASDTIKPLNYSVESVKEHKSFTLVKYIDSTWVKYMWWAHLIGLIWISEFILGCQQVVIAGAVAAWYFKRSGSGGKPESRGNDSFVAQATKNLVCYHLGSVALGSFLITIFKLPRLILTYLQNKLKDSESKAVKVFVRCCLCSFYCMECFIKIMNHNAYTVVAMQGNGFCTSARIAFNSIMTNVLKFTTLNSVGDFILFLGKVIVTFINSIAALLYLRQEPDLHMYTIPLLLIAIFAFFIAHAIISLYESIVDTMFLCLCEDSRMNREDGKWKENKLVKVNELATEQELTPINC